MKALTSQLVGEQVLELAKFGIAAENMC